MPISHPFPPVFDSSSRILILGSFPSVKSREQMFFYGHPQNRFWRVLAMLYGVPVPGSIEEKKELLIREHIALWDSVRSCEITGSSDASIKNVIPNDLSLITDSAEIREIFCNGAFSHQVYEKYIYPVTGRHAVRLPSTSPANAAWSPERLAEAWRVIL